MQEQQQKLNERRAKLEADLLKLLLEFQEETGLTPVDIDLRVLVGSDSKKVNHQRLTIAELKVGVKL